MTKPCYSATAPAGGIVKDKNIKAFLSLVGLLSAILLFSSCAGFGGAKGDAAKPPPGAEAAAPAETAPAPPPETPVRLRILCAGDVMAHAPQLKAQWDNSTGLYDFNNNFAYVKEYVSAADLALCNLETTLGGEPYTGYPTF
jgi:hypothetical protein